MLFLSNCFLHKFNINLQLYFQFIKCSAIDKIIIDKTQKKNFRKYFNGLDLSQNKPIQTGSLINPPGLNSSSDASPSLSIIKTLLLFSGGVTTSSSLSDL
jgi:hypothetical protein